MIKLDKGFISFCVVLVLGYGFFYLFTGHGLPCIFHELTGLFCPGCGVSRMIISFIKLDFYQSFRYNPLIFVIGPVVGLIFLLEFIYYSKNKCYFKLPKGLYIALIVLVLAFGIIRNIPFFSYLIPTVVK